MEGKDGEKMSKVNLNEQAQEILRIAEKHGVESNFFFITTFKRYQVQIGILNDLEKTIKDEGTLVTKEYVKGRKNIYSHPAISDYNRTTDSANKTVVTLMKIITTLRDRQNDDDFDPLLEIFGGRATPGGNSRSRNNADKRLSCPRQSENVSDEPYFEEESDTR